MSSGRIPASQRIGTALLLLIVALIIGFMAYFGQREPPVTLPPVTQAATADSLQGKTEADNSRRTYSRHKKHRKSPANKKQRASSQQKPRQRDFRNEHIDRPEPPQS